MKPCEVKFETYNPNPKFIIPHVQYHDYVHGESDDDRDPNVHGESDDDRDPNVHGENDDDHVRCDRDDANAQKIH